MAERIVYNFDAMASAKQSIEAVSNDLANAATTLKNAIDSNIANWTGASKDKFVLFMDSINNFTGTSIKNSIDALAQLLDQNATAMQDADNELAKNIPDAL